MAEEKQFVPAEEINRARNSGYFTEQQINELIDKQRPYFATKGFDDNQVNEYYGVKSFDTKPVKNYFDDIAKAAFSEVFAAASPLVESKEQKEAVGEKAVEGIKNELKYGITGTGRTDLPTFKEYFEAGLQQSTVGMLVRGKAPDIQIPEDSPLAQRVAMQSAALAGDIPAMAVGGLASAEGGPVTAAGGAFAFPAALRKILMDGYADGSINNFGEFWDRLQGTAFEGFKGFVTGALTKKAGEVVPASYSLPAEVAAMTTVGHALEGEMPTQEDFLDAAILVGGMHAVGKLVNKQRDVFSSTGKSPKDVVKDMQQDPRIAEDILSENVETPRAYEDLVQPLSQKTEAKPSAPEPLPDTPENRVLSRISVGEKDKKSYKPDDLYTDFFDDLFPLQRATSKMTDIKTAKATENPYKLARLTRGMFGKTEEFLQYQTRDFKTKEANGPALQAALDPIKNDLDNFRSFAVAKRAIELQGRDIETGIEIKDAREVVKKFEKDPKFVKALEEVNSYQDRTLKYLLDAEIISNKMYKAMKEANKDYVPFYRVMDEGSATGAGKGLQTRNPLKKIKGSERVIVDPLESIIKNTHLYVTLAERNEVAKQFVKLAKDNPDGSKFAKKIKTKVRPITAKEKEIKKFLKQYEEELGMELEPAELTLFRASAMNPAKNEIVVFEKGKPQLYQVNQKLADIFKGLDAETSSLLFKILGAPTRLLRAGVTLNPDFMARNLSRDQLTAGIFSTAGYRPLIDGFSGIGSLFKKDKAFKDWLASGGANAEFVSLDRKYLQENMQKLLREGNVLNEIKNPLQLLRVMSALIENSTRLGAFKKKYNKAIKGGMSHKEAMAEAGFESREATLDFARKGARMKAAVQLVEFINPTIQGTDRIVRAFKDKPLETSAKIAAYITIPSVLLYAANRDDPRYQDLPQWQKDIYWIIPTDNWIDITGKEQQYSGRDKSLYRKENGKTFYNDGTIYRIPKPFGPGLVFGTGAEKFMEFIHSKDPKAFDGFLLEIAKDIAPNAIPTFAKPFIESWANRSFFTGSPIIPASRENWLPEYQSQPYTSELTKKLGSMVAGMPGMKENKVASPAVIDTFIQDWSGGLGRMAVNAADLALRKAGALPDPNKPQSTLSDIPLIKAFVVRNPSMSTQPIQDFYDSYNRNEKFITTIKGLAKEGKPELAMRELSARQARMFQLTPIKQAMDNLNKTIRFVEQNPKIDPVEKRQKIDSLYFRMNTIAKAGNKIFEKLEKVESR